MGLDELQVTLPPKLIEDFCRRWKISRLEIFGSAIREDFRQDSDVDFLYTLASDAKWGWQFFDAADELAAIVGHPVDLISRFGIEHSRNEIRRNEILSSAKVIYAA